MKAEEIARIALDGCELWEQRAKYMLQAEARRADCGGCGHIVWQFREDSVLGDGKGGFMPVENRKYNDDVTLHECADQGVLM